MRSTPTTVLMILVALLIGCGVGVAIDRILRRIVVRWCRECGQPLGTTCVECRDRRRAKNLRHSNNERRDMLTDAG
jgi:hypothetical protein